jgi:hypothetical protein
VTVGALSLPDRIAAAVEEWLTETVRGILVEGAKAEGANREMIVRAVLRAATQFALEERAPADVAAALRQLAKELEK